MCVCVCVCVCQDLLLFGSEGARRRRRITIITAFIHSPLETSASRAIQHPIGRGWVLWRPPGTGKLDGRPPRQRRSGTHSGAVCSGDHDGSWRVRVRVRVRVKLTPPPPQNKKIPGRNYGLWWVLVRSGHLGALWNRGHLGALWRGGHVGRSGGADMWDALEKQEKARSLLLGSAVL